MRIVTIAGAAGLVATVGMAAFGPPPIEIHGPLHPLGTWIHSVVGRARPASPLWGDWPKPGSTPRSVSWPRSLRGQLQYGQWSEWSGDAGSMSPSGGHRQVSGLPSSFWRLRPSSWRSGNKAALTCSHERAHEDGRPEAGRYASAAANAYGVLSPGRVHPGDRPTKPTLDTSGPACCRTRRSLVSKTTRQPVGGPFRSWLLRGGLACHHGAPIGAFLTPQRVCTVNRLILAPAAVCWGEASTLGPIASIGAMSTPMLRASVRTTMTLR